MRLLFGVVVLHEGLKEILVSRREVVDLGEAEDLQQVLGQIHTAFGD